jgi:hypothetical protein
MESVSPDLEAFYCYLVVLVVGLLVARGQVSTKLRNFPGYWVMPGTWLLFLAFTLVPVVLFWSLDRTGAIHDTSLFAALLVGFGYQQILAGGLASLKAPGEASKLWQPFSKWTDRVAENVAERVQRNDSRFRERVIADLAKDENKLAKMEILVLSRSSKPGEVQRTRTELEEVRQSFQSVSEESARENVAKHLYRGLKRIADRDAEFLMYRRGVTSWATYYWYAREWRSKTFAFGAAAFVLLSVLWTYHQFDRPEYRLEYYAWRLGKPGITPADRFRATRNLLAFLGNEASSAATCGRLAELLRDPELQVASVDQVLSLLMEGLGANSGNADQMLPALVGALRTGSIDARARVHDALLHLAPKAGYTPVACEGLNEWKPIQGNSLTELDQYVDRWNEVLKKRPCPPSGLRSAVEAP